MVSVLLGPLIMNLQPGPPHNGTGSGCQLSSCGSEKLALDSGFRCPRTASNLASAASTAVIALQTAQYNLADGSVEAIKQVWSAPMFQLSFRV